MRSWIQHTRGRHVRQARVGLGDLREEHISRQGFFGPVAMIYREHGPNEIVRVEGALLPRRVAETTRAEPGDSHMLVVESPAPLELTEHKQTGRHMPVDPTVLVLPELCDFGFPRADE